jgi:hypothetical protein
VALVTLAKILGPGSSNIQSYGNTVLYCAVQSSLSVLLAREGAPGAEG